MLPDRQNIVSRCVVRCSDQVASMLPLVDQQCFSFCRRDAAMVPPVLQHDKHSFTDPKQTCRSHLLLMASCVVTGCFISMMPPLFSFNMPGLSRQYSTTSYGDTNCCSPNKLYNPPIFCIRKCTTSSSRL